MTLGERLIDEITACGRRGRYFDMQGYQTLRGVDSPEGLRVFLLAQGYERIVVGTHLADVARQLALLKPGVCDVSVVTFLAGTAMAVLAFAFAMLLGPVTAESQQDVETFLILNLITLVPLLWGFWYGLVQQSLGAIFWGIAVGAATGGLERFLCAHDLLAALIVGPLVIGPLMVLALAPERRPWRHDAGERFVRGFAFALALLFIGFLCVGCAVLTRSSVAAGVPLVRATLTEHRLALSLVALTFSPWAGIALLWFHCATGLSHPLRGPCLTLFISHPTPGLDRIVGKPQAVYKVLYRRIRQEDPVFRRHQRWYQLSSLAYVLLFLAVMLSFLDFMALGQVSPYWVATARIWSIAFFAFVSPLLQHLLSAAMQQSCSTRLVQELQKFPAGTTLDELKAALMAKKDERSFVGWVERSEPHRDKDQ